MKKLFYIFLVSIFVSGCATNPYNRFYTDYSGRTSLAENPRLIVSQEQPKVKRGNNALDDAKKMRMNGFVLLGESSFNAGSVNDNLARQQARIINAEVVLLYSQHTETLSGSTPLTLPDIQTSSSSGSAYGSGGYTNLYGSSSTTTYGTQTTYIPYHVRRYSYKATFWARPKGFSLGIHVQDLTDEQRRKIESNKGAVISVVVKGTPAFQNDFFNGDIIKNVNGEEIVDAQHCQQCLRETEDKKLTITILRGSNTITKTIKLDKDTTQNKPQKNPVQARE